MKKTKKFNYLTVLLFLGLQVILSPMASLAQVSAFSNIASYSSPIADQSGYSSASKINSSPVAKKNPATWMSEISDDTLLRSINLPGTHDSAAISTWYSAVNIWSCQDRSITDQLKGGIRLLDVRLKVEKDDGSNSYYFVTCHGPIGSSANANEYQSFDSLLNECRNFLIPSNNTAPTEAIVMLLKIDDWNGFDNDSQNVMSSLSNKLESSGLFYANKGMPQLGEVRGKIYLLNRIDSLQPYQGAFWGTYIQWGNNTSYDTFYSDTAGTFNIQDHYDYRGNDDPTTAKIEDFTNAISKLNSNFCLINFASAVTSPFGIAGVYINEDVIKFLNMKKFTLLGWSLFDQVFSTLSVDPYGLVDCVDLIIDSNFGYPYYSQTFRDFSQPSVVITKQSNNNESTGSTPTLDEDGYIYFRGTNNKLYRIKADNSEEKQELDGNLTSSAPFVKDDYVYFRGTNDKLYRIKKDGSEGKKEIDGNYTSSTPFVADDDYVYFRGTNDKLYRIKKDGSGGKTEIGDNLTSSMPFVKDDYVYFRGTNNKLYRIKTDGSEGKQGIGGNLTSSTPFVADDGYIYFRGTDDRLYKIKKDGSGGKISIGENTTSSMPFVTNDGYIYFQGTNGGLYRIAPGNTKSIRLGDFNIKSTPCVIGSYVCFQGTNDILYTIKIGMLNTSLLTDEGIQSSPVGGKDGYIYFRGTNDKLYRVRADGSGSKQELGGSLTSSAPFVAEDGYVYFRGTNDKLYRIKTDGSEGEKELDGNLTSSTPFVKDGYVYFRGTNDKLYRMKTDGSESKKEIGGNLTSSTPFVANDGYVYFRGTNDKLYRIKTDGSEGKQEIGGNLTSSMPFVANDGYVYFRGTNNKLYRTKTDRTGDKLNIGGYMTNASPFVIGNTVYFQGVDNKLWAVKANENEGFKGTYLNNETSSTPFVTEEGRIYFQGTNNKLYVATQDSIPNE